MLNMRIKIDVWSKGVDEDIRHQGRENLRELFCQLPPRRVYLYMKATRSMVLNERHRKEGLRSPKDLAEHIVQGPEDAIAKGKSIDSSKSTPRCVCLNSLQQPQSSKATAYQRPYTSQPSTRSRWRRILTSVSIRKSPWMREAFGSWIS